MKHIVLAIFGLALASSTFLTACSSSGDKTTPTTSPSGSATPTTTPTETPKP